MDSSATARLPSITEQRAAVRQWVQWLADGECSEAELIEAVLEDDSDAAWEVMAQLDQAFRLGRMPAAPCHRVTARLKRELLRADAGELGVGSSSALGAGGTATQASHPDEAITRLPRLYVRDFHRSPLRDTEPPSERLAIGDLVQDRYRITGVLQRAVDGSVFEALDTAHAHTPASLLLHLISDDRSRDIDLLQRLYSLQALDHPAIASVLDVEEEDGELFYTMERLDGATLAQRQQDARCAGMSIDQARDMLGAVAAALVHAHAHDICHGDLSAAQVLITNNGATRLQGFTLDPSRLATGIKADGVAFARLAYELLWQCEAPGASWRAEGALQQPRCISSRQWQALRATLVGDREAGARLLGLFASGKVEVRDDQAAPRRAAAHLVAASILAAMLGFGGYLLFAAGPSADEVLLAQSQ